MFINKKYYNSSTVLYPFYTHSIRPLNHAHTAKGRAPLFMEARPFSEFYSPFFIAYTLRFNPHGDYNRPPRGIP